MESRGDAYIMIEEIKSNLNICNKAGFTIWLCKYFGPKFQIDLNCLRKISSPMYLPYPISSNI
jgi:hypothetical protein